MKLLLIISTCAFAACHGFPKLPGEPVFLTNSASDDPGGARDAQEVDNTNMSAAFNKSLIKRLPQPQSKADKQIFVHYSADSVSPRAKNWLEPFDFSGVAWDHVRTATLVGPRHVIMAKHFQRPKGSDVVFHRRDGSSVTRKIIDKESLTIADLTIGLLDREATGCTVYPVLGNGHDWESILLGTYCFVTNRERKVLLYKASSFGPIVGFRQSDALVDPIMREPVIEGDSGNPTFLPHGDNQLVLLSTHWFGGDDGASGPNLAHTLTQSTLRTTIAKLEARNDG